MAESTGIPSPGDQPLVVQRVLASRESWGIAEGETVDWVCLQAAQALRPYLRTSTSTGRPILLALERGAMVRDGDLLHRNGSLLVAARVAYPPAVEITLPPLEGTPLLLAALRLAHFLGNHHHQLRILPDARVRVPTEDADSLVHTLQQGPVPGLTVRVVEGSADDPPPNPQAHHHG